MKLEVFASKLSVTLAIVVSHAFALKLELLASKLSMTSITFVKPESALKAWILASKPSLYDGDIHQQYALLMSTSYMLPYRVYKLGIYYSVKWSALVQTDSISDLSVLS